MTGHQIKWRGGQEGGNPAHTLSGSFPAIWLVVKRVWVGKGDAASPSPIGSLPAHEPAVKCMWVGGGDTPPPSLNLTASHSARKLGARKKREVKVKTPWVVTRNLECTKLFFGEVRENARRDAVCKMRTDARRKSISGTHTQLCIYVLKMEFYTKKP